MPQKKIPPITTVDADSHSQPEGIDFVYSIDGDNQLDLNELLPILGSLGELIQEGNRIVNPESPDIRISVKPFEKGSFQIEMLLAPESAGALFAFVQAGGLKEITDVLSNIGLVFSKTKAAYTSLLDLYKKLKGCTPKDVKEIEKGAKFEIITQEGEAVQINGNVQKMYQNSTIVQNLTVVFNEPLKKPKRKKVRSYIKNQEKDTLVEFTPQDAQSLDDAKPLELPTAQQAPEEVENTTVVFLRPKRGSFEGESSKWSFRKGSRHGEVLQANIKDSVFLQQLESGEIRLSANDLLQVELREKQRVVGSDLRTTNEIVKVLKYSSAPPSPRQVSIDLGGTDGSESL